MENKYPEDLNKMVEITESMVKTTLIEMEGSHDWFHIERVRKTAMKIAQKEGGDQFLIEMASLLHDLDDWKLNIKGNEDKTSRWLNSLHLDEYRKHQIIRIISEISYKGAGISTPCSSIESMIVQDADRLDALGAIGIARAFAYGGWKGHPIHLPGIQPTYHSNLKDYQNHRGSTILHFREKLLLLKDRMNTQSASEIANRRHQFMLNFLEQFFDEWDQEI